MKTLTFVITFFYSFSLFSASTTVDQLEKDTRSLKTDLGTLQSKMDSFKAKLTTLEQRLAIPSHIAHDLGNLDHSMTTVKDVSKVASVVPPIRSQAQTVNDGISEVQPPVQEAKKVMDEIAEAIEPVRQAVIKARDEIGKIEDKIGEFKAKKISPFYNSVLSSQSCVDQADPKHHQCMQDQLDSAAKPADAVVGTSDQAIKTLLAEIEKIEDLIKSIEDSIDGIEVVIKGVNILEEALHILISPFLEIGKLLKQTFQVRFQYPDPGNIFKKKWFYIKMSGADIIKGINAIIKKIKAMLKGALLKFAETFGLKKLATDLFDLLDNPLKFIIKKMHLKIKIDVPGLGTLKGLGIKLKNPLKDLQLGLAKIKIDFQTPKITACGELSKTCK